DCVAFRLQLIGGQIGHANPEITPARFHRAFMLEARFEDLMAKHVDFSGADLRRTSWKRVDLTGACLVDVDLTGARFEKVNLSGANLTGARGWTENLARGAEVDESTQLP
ncbi:MAG: pentapeptide repeat-containing protein, partial [Planctomycetota bacterium]